MAERYTFPVCDLCGESTYTCGCDTDSDAHPERFVKAPDYDELANAGKRADETCRELAW